MTSTATYYRKERAAMWKAYADHPRNHAHKDCGHAKGALARARIMAEWWDRETDDEIAGAVRLRWEPDDHAHLDDLLGDCYDPRANPDISPARVERERKEAIEKIDRDGVWGLIGEYYDGTDWKHAESCWGFIGQDADDYAVDIMAATLDAARDHDWDESTS